MGSIGAIVSRGFGPWGSIGEIVTVGYGIGDTVVVPDTTPCRVYTVAREDRNLRIPHEERIFAAAYENRTSRIK